MEKIRVANGIYWVAIPEADLFILCGCPADSVKHLMKMRLIVQMEKNGITFETGPNAILLSDTTTQKGGFSNLGEFPVLQMLYRQGMIVPGHPNNTGRKPMLVGLEDQVKSQSLYIYRGTYGLTSEEEMIAAGTSAAEARRMMRVKKWFAFGQIKRTEDLLDLRIVDKPAVELRDGVFIRRRGFNRYEFLYGGESVHVDLNLAEDQEYQPSYTLGFHRVHREYFSVVHIGEGDGWNPDLPCMGSMIVFQGRIYLVDAGPNITYSLTALGIGINEVKGVFVTHAHDDHFAGLTSLTRSDHRIAFYAAPLVRASVVKKYVALTGGRESDFNRYFETRDLAFDSWSSIDGLEVMPLYSLHPIETSVLMFRALWEGGYKTYAHLADIVSSDTLKNMRARDSSGGAVDPGFAEKYFTALRRSVDLKKIDVGGGPIHGRAKDFSGDASKRIILSHLSTPLSEADKEIGSSASFGHDDVLIPAHAEYHLETARTHLRAYLPGAPDHDIAMLANCQRVEVNPGSIMLKQGDRAADLFLILGGVAEYIDSKAGLLNRLSSGALIGELTGSRRKRLGGTVRAASHISALRIPRGMYEEVIRRNSLDDTIRRMNENRQILQDSWLFGEMVSFPVQLRIAKLMQPVTVGEGESVWAGGTQELYLIADGLVTIFSGSKPIENLKKGAFFGEESVLRRSSSLFEARVTYDASLFTIPGPSLEDIPIVHWKLVETFERRLKSFRTEFAFEWRNAYRVGVAELDRHHQKLFSMISALARMPENATAASQEAKTGELVRELRAHLNREQLLLQKGGSPDLESQRKSHKAFISEIEVIRRRIPSSRDAAIRDIVDRLKDWIIDHTLLENRRYLDLLRK
jgi:hemerythrin